MSTSNTGQPEDDEDWSDFDLRKFIRQTIQSIEFGDSMADVLEDRVMRIEECLAAPWYRRWLLWRRLRREIRVSVSTWDPAYIAPGDFRAGRLEWAMQASSARYQRHGWKPRFDRPAEAAQDAPERPAEGGADPGAGFLP